MKILGLDIGEKRIGVAVAESETGLIFPREALAAEDRKSLDLLFKEFAQAEIVVGLPLNNDGTESRQAGKIREYMQQLNLSVKVSFINEYGSSREAESRFRSLGKRGKIKKGAVDSVSATLILENYLAQSKKV